MDRNKLKQRIEKVVKDIDFAGAVYIKQKNEVIYESAFGFANRAEKRKNKVDTRYGIASGCKLFTAIAICQLVEQGKLSFQTRLIDCIDIDFPYFDEEITIHHLLTHSAGIPDYFDEEVMSDYEDLWKSQPVYAVKNLRTFLPLFQNEKMKFKPGHTFHYNNAGYIILGLVVEQQSGMVFTDYVEKEIFLRCGMKDSGYFSMDNLPANTAYGYIDEADGSFRTNIFSIPIKGGSDGGAFVSAADMTKLWECLFDHTILNSVSTGLLLTQHIKEKDDWYYGYGIWIKKVNNHVFNYHVMGYDPGVSFHGSVYPDKEVKIIVCSNKQSEPFSIIKEIENIIQEG